MSIHIVKEKASPTSHGTNNSNTENASASAKKEPRIIKRQVEILVSVLALGVLVCSRGIRIMLPSHGSVQSKEGQDTDDVVFLSPEDHEVLLLNMTKRNRNHRQKQQWQNNNKRLSDKASEQFRLERLERHKQQKNGRKKQQKSRNPTSIDSRYQKARIEPSKPLKVPYPIFVLNLPKTGTTTLWQYFECGLGPDRAIHWWTTQRGKLIGPCVERNIKHNQPPLQGCGNFDVWIDFGYAEPKKCFFPAVHALEALYKSYPNATYLWIRRDTESWFNSAKKWGKMFQKWKTACRKDFFPEKDDRTPIHTEDFKHFYEATTQRIRQFAKENPGMRYLEPNMTLSSPHLGAWLEETFGIEESCWGKCQPNGKDAKCEDRKAT